MVTNGKISMVTLCGTWVAGSRRRHIRVNPRDRTTVVVQRVRLFTFAAINEFTVGLEITA
jgi:hypothetical protein